MPPGCGKVVGFAGKSDQVLRDGNYVEVAAEDIQIDDDSGPSGEKDRG